MCNEILTIVTTLQTSANNNLKKIYLWLSDRLHLLELWWVNVMIISDWPVGIIIEQFINDTWWFEIDFHQHVNSRVHLNIQLISATWKNNNQKVAHRFRDISRIMFQTISFFGSQVSWLYRENVSSCSNLTILPW